MDLTKDNVEVEDLEDKYDEILGKYKIISEDYKDQQSKISELVKEQDANTFLEDSLLFKFRRFTNMMSESCLVQIIAILFCIVVILLLKL
ncbi:hypothetical protein SteCoe_29107 [Stentor coeruleus]|uniref:Uncharacterized protein n=1 Tax=Stentor coeruleus TaxID=5963 RepID=A0A1R2B6Q5_9CILI|nr:hypothetical protein SteCoe_29107 [Stentor coeruleus]